MFGDTTEVINYYLNKSGTQNAVIEYPIKPNLDGQITKVEILNENEEPSTKIPVGEKFFIEVDLDIRKPLHEKCIFLHFFYHGDLLLFSMESDEIGKYNNYEVGKYRVRIEVPSFLFQIGTTFVRISLKHLRDGGVAVDQVSDIGIDIKNEKNPKEPVQGDHYWGKLSTILKYKTKKISEK
jgi:hypothetical protein